MLKNILDQLTGKDIFIFIIMYSLYLNIIFVYLYVLYIKLLFFLN